MISPAESGFVRSSRPDDDGMAGQGTFEQAVQIIARGRRDALRGRFRLERQSSTEPISPQIHAPGFGTIGRLFLGVVGRRPCRSARQARWRLSRSRTAFQPRPLTDLVVIDDVMHSR